MLECSNFDSLGALYQSSIFCGWSVKKIKIITNLLPWKRLLAKYFMEKMLADSFLGKNIWSSQIVLHKVKGDLLACNLAWRQIFFSRIWFPWQHFLMMPSENFWENVDHFMLECRWGRHAVCLGVCHIILKCWTWTLQFCVKMTKIFDCGCHSNRFYRSDACAYCQTGSSRSPANFWKNMKPLDCKFGFWGKSDIFLSFTVIILKYFGK